MEGLKGKTVLITGGSSGIGRATSLEFAKQGTNVVVCSIQPQEGADTVAEIKKGGGDAIFVEMDVTKSDQVEAAVNKAVEAFGSLHFAFNNAGINGEVAPIPEYSEEGWDSLININLKGVWLCMKYEIPQIIKTGGVIVNNASIGGLVSFPLDVAPYVASKHGVIGLTKAAAREYATKGIRVNAVCPGAVKTPLNQDIPDELTKPIIDGHPMGRWGRPEEVAGAVLFMCSEEASFITGSSLMIDGGFTAI